MKERKISEESWRISYDNVKFFWKNKNVSKSTQSLALTNLRESRQSFTELKQNTANLGVVYKNLPAFIHFPNRCSIKLSRKDLIWLVKLKELHHDNLISFLGACLDDGHLFYLTQYCHRGSLQEIIRDENFNMEWSFKISFIFDIVKGMAYLHNSFLSYHGNLTSSHCLVDNRWVVKVGGFTSHIFNGPEKHFKNFNEDYYKKLLWTAPEILKSKNMNMKSQKGDVYSFAIICHEIIYRSYPFQFSNLTEKEIIEKIMNGGENNFRPPVPSGERIGVKHFLTDLIKECWDDKPEKRPSFEQCNKQLQNFFNKSNFSLVDNMVQKLEKYANNLESIVEQRTKELRIEKMKTDRLLDSMLPSNISIELKLGRKVEAKLYEMCTIYFSDIVGFEVLSSQSTPIEIVNLLNDLYGIFDETIAKHDVYKVETIGDSYMVVSGLPKMTEHHIVEISNMALELLNLAKKFQIRHRPNEKLMLRIGIHSGPCAAGVVGYKTPRYCLFGDTVNTASRMESTGEALKIHLSSDAKEGISKYPGYVTEVRGMTELKGKGKMMTHWLKKKLEL